MMRPPLAVSPTCSTSGASAALEAGADCIWERFCSTNTPFEKSSVNDLKHAWIERIGDECLAHDIPFFLEFLGYDAHGLGMKSLSTMPKKEAEIVSGSMAESWQSALQHVDVLKVEVPVEMAFVEGTRSFKGEKA